MYVMNVVFKGSGIIQGFTFKDKESAGDYQNRLLLQDGGDILSIRDDYGTDADIIKQEVAAVAIVDVKVDLERSSEVQLLQAKAQIRYQNKIKQDPSINIKHISGLPQ